MAEEPPVLPETIDLEQTKFEEHARDRADRAVSAAIYIVLLDIVIVVASFAVAHFLSKPMEPWLIIFLLCSIPASMLFSGAFWLPAHLQRKHYISKAQSTYTLRSHDTRHEWRIEGICSARGWRDISIECKKLPRQFIASPKLLVRVDNEQGVLKSGHIQDGGEDTSLFVIDKAGLPIGITIGHAEPKHASQEEPWVVELTLFGDADALETLLAWPAAWHRDGPDIGFEQADANRQA